jgi:hypothetical protein
MNKLEKNKDNFKFLGCNSKKSCIFAVPRKIWGIIGKNFIIYNKEVKDKDGIKEI